MERVEMEETVYRLMLDLLEWLLELGPGQLGGADAGALEGALFAAAEAVAEVQLHRTPAAFARARRRVAACVPLLAELPLEPAAERARTLVAEQLALLDRLVDEGTRRSSP